MLFDPFISFSLAHNYFGYYFEVLEATENFSDDALKGRKFYFL